MQSTQQSDTRAGRALSLCDAVSACSCIGRTLVRLHPVMLATYVDCCAYLLYILTRPCPIFLTLALVCLRARASACGAQRCIKPIISSKYGTAGSWRAQGLSTAEMFSKNEAKERQEKGTMTKCRSIIRCILICFILFRPVFSAKSCLYFSAMLCLCLILLL